METWRPLVVNIWPNGWNKIAKYVRSMIYLIVENLLNFIANKANFFQNMWSFVSFTMHQMLIISIISIHKTITMILFVVPRILTTAKKNTQHTRTHVRSLIQLSISADFGTAKFRQNQKREANKVGRAFVCRFVVHSLVLVIALNARSRRHCYQSSDGNSFFCIFYCFNWCK